MSATSAGLRTFLLPAPHPDQNSVHKRRPTASAQTLGILHRSQSARSSCVSRSRAQ